MKIEPEQKLCPHCGSTDDGCWWFEFHDGDEAPCGSHASDEEEGKP